MVRVFLITVNKVYRQRVFVTVACHGHGSAVYACIFMAPFCSFSYQVPPGYVKTLG